MTSAANALHMSLTIPLRLSLAALAAIALMLTGRGAIAQGGGQPTNDVPNAYQTIAGHFKMPAGRTWGSTSAVEIDVDGRSIWIAERCGANSCAGSSLPVLLKFDSSGRLVRSFAAGTFVWPHGIHVDREGNIWVTDGREATAGELKRFPALVGKGHQVYKFGPDGKLLMTLGTPGGKNAPDYFFQPNDVVVGPTGEIFVSQGHGQGVSEILKFSKDGTLITRWGKTGDKPGEFNQPHALAFDSKGRLFVGDRSNNRIQIFDQQGAFIEQWFQFSRPSGIYIDRHDNIYVADSESGSVDPKHGAWKRGIRVGNVKDGTVTQFIPDPDNNATDTSAAEGVAADAAGNIYGAEVGPRGVKKYVKKS